MKTVAWITVVIIALIMLALVYYLVVGAILFKMVFSRKSTYKRLLRKDLNKALIDYKIDLCWWDKVKFSKITIQSFDQIKLVGHFFNADSDKTVIIVHGFGQDYREMQPYCKYFYHKNFNILAVDNRGHGESEGCIGFALNDKKDILSWIEYLNKKNPNSDIVLFGLSMGGSAVCAVAGETLPSNVRAIISDCAFSNADKQIKHVMRNNKLILKLFRKHLYDFAKRVRCFDIAQIDLTRAVKKTSIPMLFIHGKEDNFVPYENVYQLYDAATNRDIYVVDGAKHAMSYPVAGVLYEKKIGDFIKSRTNVNF